MTEFNRIRHILSCTRRAVEQYGMIEPGDRIAVGVSGGKDSLALLCALINLRRFYPAPYEICAIYVHMGFAGIDIGPLHRFCRENGVELRVVVTRLSQVIFADRCERSPCSLCARMRRGILHDTAKAMGCNKLALGHHFDDAVETFLLNLFHEGRLGAFLPVTYMSRKDLTVIRPLMLVEEKDVRYFVGKNELPLLPSLCPMDGKTQREEAKRLLAELDRKHKGLKHRIFVAMEKGGLLEQNESTFSQENGME